MMELILSPELFEEYSKITDSKVKGYTPTFEKEEEEVDLSPQLEEWITDYIFSNPNILDTTESSFYKEGARLGISIRLLVKNNDSFEDIFQHFNIFDHSSIDNLRSRFERSNPILTFEQFIEGRLVLAEEQGNSALVISKFEKLFQESSKKFDLTDFGDVSDWNEKKAVWEEAEKETLQKICERQFGLLMYSIHPEIKRALVGETFKIKSRQLFFRCENGTWSNSSVYDRFILSQASEDVPFIKVSLFSGPKNGDEIYKIYTKVQRDDINDWVSKNENNIFEERKLEAGGDDSIFCLIKFDNDSSQHAEATLGKNGLHVSIPSSYSLETAVEKTKEIIAKTFLINLHDWEERSTKVSTYLANFPHTQASYLQFFLLTSESPPFYMKGLVNSETTRKVRLYGNSYSSSFSERERYIIEYETSRHELITITGPSEEKCIRYFVNTFGRFIQAFFLHRDAIHLLFNKTISGLETLEEHLEKKGKKKKKSSTNEPHLLTKKSKIEYIKSLLSGFPKDYSSKCQCERQPIILTDEEAEAWQRTGKTIFTEEEKPQRPKEIKRFVHNGKIFNFACPSDEYPEIHLRVEKKNANGQYDFSPCCFDKQWVEGDDDEVVMAISGEEKSHRKTQSLTTAKHDYNDDESQGPAFSKSLNDLPRYSEADVQDLLKQGELTSHFLPAELKQFLISVRDGDYNVKNISLGRGQNKSTLLECIIEALRLKKKSIRTYRSEIATATSPALMLQETITVHDQESVYASLGDPGQFLTSSLHYRALEEFFKIHLYVFVLNPYILVGGSEDKNNYNPEDDFYLEIPPHKIFSAKTLYRDRPTILLTKIQGIEEYGLITDKKDGKSFFYSLSEPMHDIFNFFYETTSVTNVKDQRKIAKNIYSRINWENFFQKSDIKIIAQEVDIAGKTRVIQLNNGAVLNIPPCQPLNVPLIEEYSEITEEESIKLFGEPHDWDEKGLWYALYDIPFSVYVLTGPHSRSKVTTNGIRDQPLNIFVPLERKDQEIRKSWLFKKCSFALVQIIHWAWRYDGRKKFSTWFPQHVKIDPNQQSNNTFPYLTIQSSLPNEKTILSVSDGLRQINRWWPEVFSPTGKIVLHPVLYERLLAFFERENDLMEGYTRDEISTNLIGIYEYSSDYPAMPNVRIFTTTQGFLNWAKVERKKEENVEIHCYERLLDQIYQRDSPVRLLYKGLYPLVLQNTKSGEKASALHLSYLWKTEKINLGRLEDVDPLPEKILSQYEIAIFTVTKTMSFYITEIEEGKTRNRLYIFRYPDGSFASILED